ncbi:MAG: acyl-CoA dehydrogenase family protein, partial [Candidatus Binatia bacterium]
MAIDFSFPPEIDELRSRMRDFIENVVRSTEAEIDESSRDSVRAGVITMRKEAIRRGLWLPHMPKEWGGMGLGHVAMAMMSAEAARARYGPFAINAQAPDEGNMHTILHWGTEEQKQKYLKPLCEGRARSCFAMTEPEVAGSDPTLIRTHAVLDGDFWVVNGHKWFISGARSARFAILIARTEENPEIPQAANSAFLVDLPVDGWKDVREIATMHGATGHSEIVIENLRIHRSQMLGGRGEGHLLGQYRLGPARLAHCMRWIGQAETALEMMVDRATKRFAHGSLLSEKQGIQWMIADSTMELY